MLQYKEIESEREKDTMQGGAVIRTCGLSGRSYIGTGSSDMETYLELFQKQHQRLEYFSLIYLGSLVRMKKHNNQ